MRHPSYLNRYKSVLIDSTWWNDKNIQIMYSVTKRGITSVIGQKWMAMSDQLSNLLPWDTKLPLEHLNTKYKVIYSL